MRVPIAIAILAVIARSAVSQIVTDPAPVVPLSSRDTHAITVPPATPSALIEFTGDPDAAGGDVFDVSVSDPTAVVSLILPSNAEVTAANAAGLGFSFVVIPAGSFAQSKIPNLFSSDGTHTLVVIPAGSNSGKYKVKINTGAALANTLVIAGYYSSSKVKAGLFSDSPFYRVGDTVLLLGLLFEGSAPITSAVLKAKVGDPSDAVSPPVDVNLLDSGTYDVAAGDGIYTGTYLAGKPGTFTAAMEATGVAAGGAFARTAATEFKVVPPSARFSSFADAGVDDNGNGQFDRIVVTATINVVKAGNYDFGIQMSKGTTILSSKTTASVGTGTQQLAVSFPAAQLRSLPGNGPYSLAKASLIYSSDPAVPLVDYRESAGTTKPYLQSQFEQPPVFLTGVNAVTPLDTNGNKKYDILRVTAGVGVAAAGFYQWSARLTDVYGKEIDFASGSGSFNAGASNSLILDFSGLKIGRNARNGPYFVRSLLLFSGNNSLVVDQLAQTPAYSVLLFEGARCPGDLNSDNIVDAKDLSLVQSAFGRRCSQSGFNALYDVNGDCVIDVRDLSFVAQSLGCKSQ